MALRSGDGSRADRVLYFQGLWIDRVMVGNGGVMVLEGKRRDGEV